VLLRDDLKEHIKVIVRFNDSEEEFLVVPALLFHHSDYIKVACSENWANGRNKEIHIDKEDPQYFAVFLAFVYTGKVEISHQLLIQKRTLYYNQEDEEDEEKMQDYIRYLQLVGCFALGSFLQSHTFQNAVMDTIHAEAASHAQKYKSLLCMGYLRIHKVYCRTAKGSALCRYVVQTISENADLNIMISRLKSYPPSPYVHEFELELLDVVWKKAGLTGKGTAELK